MMQARLLPVLLIPVHHSRFLCNVAALLTLFYLCLWPPGLALVWLVKEGRVMKRRKVSKERLGPQPYPLERLQHCSGVMLISR